LRCYRHVLLTSDAFELMVLKPRMRLDVMTALGMLTRVLGMRERWRAIRETYGLKWSREMSCVHAVLTSQTYSSLIEKARMVIGSRGLMTSHSKSLSSRNSIKKTRKEKLK
jgi:hypothetical protein